MWSEQTAQFAPGYRTLYNLAPLNWAERFRFIHCIGAALAIYAISSTRTMALRSLFDNPFSVYLGQISFALYLVHGPIIHMLGFWLVPRCWDWTGKDTMMGKETGFIIAFVIVTAITVWAADIFWRFVDVRCVSLAKWFENLVTVEQ
jgi:peptidoglycan/LPS O-acetylase OafA/YrhL